ARFAAHRLRNASESLLRPSGVIPPLRFALVFTVEAAPPEAARLAAQRALSASDSLLRPSGVIPPLGRPLRLPLAEAAGAELSPEPEASTSRSAANARSMALPCCSSCLI